MSFARLSKCAKTFPPMPPSSNGWLKSTKLCSYMTPPSVGTLCQDFCQDFAVYVGQPALDSVVIIAQALMVDAKQVQDGGVQVVNGRDVLHSLVAEVIGCAVTESLFYASPRQPHGEAVWIVIAAIGPFLERRHAPKLRHPNNQRALQKAAPFQ